MTQKENNQVVPYLQVPLLLFDRFLILRMVTNMEEWRDEWVAEVKPSDEELAKKNADIDKTLGFAASQRSFCSFLHLFARERNGGS